MVFYFQTRKIWLVFSPVLNILLLYLVISPFVFFHASIFKRGTLFFVHSDNFSSSGPDFEDFFNIMTIFCLFNFQAFFMCIWKSEGTVKSSIQIELCSPKGHKTDQFKCRGNNRNNKVDNYLNIYQKGTAKIDLENIDTITQCKQYKQIRFASAGMNSNETFSK